MYLLKCIFTPTFYLVEYLIQGYLIKELRNREIYNTRQWSYYTNALQTVNVFI